MAATANDIITQHKMTQVEVVVAESASERDILLTSSVVLMSTSLTDTCNETQQIHVRS